MKIDPRLLASIADKHAVAPKTILSAIVGLPIKGRRCRERAEAACKELGFENVVALPPARKNERAASANAA